MPNVAGGFGVWRRDILMKLGGYSPDFSCEDIELTFRAHDYLGRRGEREKKILNLPYIVGWTEGPSSVATLFQQRRRWHRVTVETTAHYRSMLFNRRYGTFGFLTMPYFAFYEVFGIFMEIASIIFVVWGAFAGILDVKLCFAILALMILCQTILSFLSLFAFNQYHKVISSRNIGLLMGWTLTEFFWYHWIVVVARIAGTIDYLRGVKMFDQYKRV
jgi:cellulose synthase/poly-beta-1,6-N-acetylglucosamine synthase-like glycosyltransferase